MTENQDNVPTIEELAAYLKTSKSTLYKLARKGEVRGRKVGKHRCVRRDIQARYNRPVASATGASRNRNRTFNS